MKFWKNDKELFALAKNELNTALIGDILDQLGYYHQFLSPNLKQLNQDMLLIGRAMPVLEADIESDPGKSKVSCVTGKPFGLMFEALDNLKEDEVYICTGASSNYALWGELMSTRAIKLSAAGAVVNGYSRDTFGIIRLNFPTFSLGTYSKDQKLRGEVIEFGKSISWDGIRIDPGTIIFGDRDGVLVIPKKTEQEVFSGAIAKARAERKVLNALKRGMTTVDAFDQYGVM